MRKSVALLLLAVFTVPYARAPICQLATHQHHEGSQAMEHGHHGTTAHGSMADAAGADDATTRGSAAHPVVTDGDVGPDCHQRMMCDAAVDQAVPRTTFVAEQRVPVVATASLEARDRSVVGPGIDLPPPRRS